MLQLSNAECEVNFQASINSPSCRNFERNSLHICHWNHEVCVCTHTHTFFCVVVAVMHVKCKEEMLWCVVIHVVKAMWWLLGHHLSAVCTHCMYCHVSNSFSCILIVQWRLLDHFIIYAIHICLWVKLLCHWMCQVEGVITACWPKPYCANFLLGKQDYVNMVAYRHLPASP